MIYTHTHVTPELEALVASDPWRPRYHFMPPAQWMNDPNGPVFWKGRYHLFYQHNPDAAVWGNMHWGHAMSEDLVHWEHLPIALAPDPDGPDVNGCFSGTALVDGDVVRMIYFGNPHGICIATSSDDDLARWEKHPANPVIPQPTHGEKYIVYDPCMWKEDGVYYALSGGSTPERRDTAFLFRSRDLEHWEYMHPFYDAGSFTDPGEDCAVPDFFPLGGKHVLLFASHLRGAQYYIGAYANHRFVPERHGRMVYAPPAGRVGTFCEAYRMTAPDGRCILFGRASEGTRERYYKDSGWSGVMTLPWELSLAADDTLLVEPARELAALRRSRMTAPAADLAVDTAAPLDGIRGACLEIDARLAAGDARACGLKLRRSPGREEETVIRYDRADATLTIDIAKASLSPRVENLQPETGPLRLTPGEDLRLRVFVDRSIVEVFANGRLCLTRRIYPTRPDSLGVAAFAEGGDARLCSLEAWDMAGIWEG
jgi:beta-fructofuranosidase